MIISSRTRRATTITAASLTLALGGLAAAAPAYAADSATCVTYGAVSDYLHTQTTTPGITAITIATDHFAITAAGSGLDCDWANGVQDSVAISDSGQVIMSAGSDSGTGGNSYFAPQTESADSLNFQADGNLVAYLNGTPVWATGTHTYPQAIFAIQDDGNFVIYPSSSDFAALWDSGTEN